MQTFMGLESLVQRGRSPFYNDLVTLYQDTQDALVGAPKASHGYIMMTLKSLKFKERMKALVKKHMNIDLNKVTVHESSMFNAICEMDYNKTYIKQNKKEITTPGMLLDKIRRLYDDDKGRLNDHNDLLPFDFNLVLYTSLWNVKDDDGSFYLTAEELAAITLHEFGHIDHFIRATWRAYGRTIDAAEVVDYLGRHPDRDLILTLIASLKKKITRDKDTIKLLNVVDNYFTTSNSMDDPYYHEALTTLLLLVASDQSAYLLGMYQGLLGGNRDRVTTLAQSVDAERSADEFSSRHGAYAALVSAVGKLYSVADNKNYLILKQFMWSGPAMVFGYCAIFLGMFNLRTEEVFYGYDPLMHRMALIVETAKHAFHDADLPEEVKHDLKKQIDDAERYIAEYKSPANRRVRAQFAKWKQDVGRFGRILASPFQNRLSIDYERLQNATRSLSRHSLYYLADKAK